MKGIKNYYKAQQIHKILYDPSTVLSKKRRITLYNKYLNCIKVAAYQGHIEAMYDLAQCFEDIGYLSIQNPNYKPRKCIYWYQKACEQNHPASFNNLAHFYEIGEGVSTDIKKAISLYKKSAELGYKLGLTNYKIILKQIKNGEYKL